MIELQIIKNECKAHKTCNSECIFYDYDSHNGCLLCCDPCDWDLPAITEAFENMSAETFNQMHESLMKKIVDVMHPDRKEVEYERD